MQENKVDRVHRLAQLLVYDLELPSSVRHPVRFFFVNDIKRAVGEPKLVAAPVPRSDPHSTSCDCRFCATDLLDTCALKLLP